MLSSVLNGGKVDLQSLLLCTFVSLAVGLVIARVHMYHNIYSKNFVVTLALMPVLVQLVIMLVNGNLGTGMAVLGAFSLVRFRSVAGGSREITSIFWSMGVGLATGMGYLGYVLIFSVIVAAFSLLLNTLHFGENNQVVERELKITIPEDLDYVGIFDDILAKYTYQNNLDSVRTTAMGSLFELRYYVKMKNINEEKALLDELRTRNGNLAIILGRPTANKEEL